MSLTGKGTTGKPAEVEGGNRKVEAGSGSRGNRPEADRGNRGKLKAEAARRRPEAGTGGAGKQQGAGRPRKGEPGARTRASAVRTPQGGVAARDPPF